LTAEFEKYIALVKKEHMDPRDEAVPPYVEKHLGGLFAVSSAKPIRYSDALCGQPFPLLPAYALGKP